MRVGSGAARCDVRFKSVFPGLSEEDYGGVMIRAGTVECRFASRKSGCRGGWEVGGVGDLGVVLGMRGLGEYEDCAEWRYGENRDSCWGSAGLRRGRGWSVSVGLRDEGAVLLMEQGFRQC